jgi:FkbM family methyltransferase
MLSIDDRLKHLLPGWAYYPHKIAQLTRRGEPELRFLRDLVPKGRLALDVGANRGLYSYALLKWTDRVEAFEPNPELAAFARRKLGRAVRVHEVALSNESGAMTLFIPQREPGIDAHYNASLKKVYPFELYTEVTVPVATLDSLQLSDVGFIKIDAEGADMDVIEGGHATIARDRPNMVVELVAETHADPLACIEHIRRTFRYDARIFLGDRLVEAREVLADRARELDTCNVVFTPA